MQQYEEANTLNSNPAHYNCYLKKATEQQTPFKEDTQDRFTHDTYPYARSWQEKAIASPITQIRYGHNLITFTVNEQMTHFDRTLSKTEPICILNNRELWIDQLNGEKARIGIYTLQGRLISQLETSDTSIAIPIDPEHKAVIVQLTTSQGIYSFKQICTK